MKKLGSLAIVGVVLLGLVLVACGPCPPYGDVNYDGRVTNADALMIAEYLVGKITLTDSQLVRADVTGDGVVNIADAMFIKQYVDGVRDTFPVCD